MAVGRAVVRNPSVLLMDEPLSNLDAALRVHTRTEIKRLQRDLEATTIFVTHDQEEAMVLSDRVAVMRLGELQQIGPPMEVYRDPVNLFVASFIGSPAMNFLEAELARGEGRLQCRVGEQTLALPADLIAGEPPQEAIVGVRPTDLMVEAERELSLRGRGVSGRAGGAGHLCRLQCQRHGRDGDVRSRQCAGDRCPGRARFQRQPGLPVRSHERATALARPIHPALPSVVTLARRELSP